MAGKNMTYQRLSEVNERQRKEILQILQSGFDPEIVANEFNILQSDLEKFLKANPLSTKKPIYIPKKAYDKNVVVAEKDRKKDISKMDIIRKKYKALYATNLPKQEITVVEPTQEDIEKASEILEDAKKDFQNLQGKSETEKREGSIRILKNLSSICDLRCSINQMQEATQLAFGDTFGRPKLSDSKEKIKREEGLIKNLRLKLTKKLVEVVKSEADKTEDYDRLVELKKMIPVSLKQGTSTIYCDTVSIDMKLRKLQLQRALDKLKYDVSDNVQSVVTGLANGNLDIEDAKQKIDAEVKAKMERNHSTDSNLAFRQVFIQIRNLFSKRAEEYQIQDPYYTMSQLTALSGQDEAYINLRAIAENYASRGKYTAAKMICSRYSSPKTQEEFEYADLSSQAHILNRELICSEIGNVIIRQINADATPEEDRMFITTLEQKMKENTLKPQAIKLGLDASGNRNITLADVWYEDKQK